jgi:hypothetical protein
MHDLLGTPKAYNNPINWKTRLNIALNAAQGSKHYDQSLSSYIPLYIHHHYNFFIISKENYLFIYF